MSTFEDLKKKWNENQDSASASAAYDQPALEKIFRSRIKKHTGRVMQYFMASFFLQVLVYAMLCAVMVRHGRDRETLLFCIAGILLFLPFTVMLMKKFKAMAIAKPVVENEGDDAGGSLYNYVLKQHDLLQGFYKFKKWYELILIPLSSAIGIFLIFKLFVPGGAAQYREAATGLFIITLITCFATIYIENKKSFEQPLHQLREVLGEFKRDA
jgi:hypothetical protein